MLYLNMWATVLIGVITILGLGYLYVRKKYSYWEKRGVYSPKPKFPMGNFRGIGFTRHQCEITEKIYNDVKGKAPFAGIYLFTHPSVVVADLDLIKQMLVKDFDYFQNRSFYYNEKDDKISAHLFAMENKQWKDLRIKLTPTFTGGKMKMMFNIVRDIANEMVTSINKIADNDGEMAVKEMVARYSTDVIGNCAFGIECNSLNNPEAEFRVNGKVFFEPTFFEQFQQVYGSAYPDIARRLKMCAVRKSLSDFFSAAVKETITIRRDNIMERNDFIQLMLEIQKKCASTSTKFTDMDIATQAFGFFLAGFETSGSTMTFALYELSRQPEIQNRLREHINDVLSKHNNEITYESINEMTYLDQVINETLRKYPVVDNLIRRTSRDYQVPGTKLIIEKDTNIFIPVYGIHRDANIYPDPMKFDPERFTAENVAQRNPFAYLPFGVGPRVCIGQRFGIMQTRLGILSAIRNFNITPCANTPDHLSYQKRSVILSPERDILFKVKRIWL